MRVTWAAITHPGLRRQTNEDSYVARPDLGLFVVADGMGGHNAGEVASLLATTTIEELVTAPPPDAGGREADGARDVGRLVAAFHEANQRIAAAANAEAAQHGMATTATAVLVHDTGQIAIAHVGDTRLYLSGEDQFTRVTTDHSWVEEQIRAGALDRAAALRHPWRNVVTRALAGPADPDVEVLTLMADPGDVLLLCSDGLHGVVSDATMEHVVRTMPDLDSACDALVRHANDAGGPDNITVVAIAFHAA